MCVITHFLFALFLVFFCFFFFFKQKTAYGMRISDWSSDVCSSDLQIVAHLAPDGGGGAESADRAANPVDGHEVPVPHFGVVLTMEDWQALADRLRAAGTAFVIEPMIRFKGQPGEQATMFFRDPAGNAIEMKAFQSLDQMFAT